jgi:type VI secretion system protein ImpH
VSKDLRRTPERFEFFQAVRLLEWLRREADGDNPDASWAPVGHDQPAQEIVRFRALNSLRFPSGEIARIDWGPEGSRRPPEMVVGFFGLTGPAGVLPRHYTETVLERIKAKDTALVDFLDLFNHRLISLFHRAWEKYRLPVAFVRAKLDTPRGDPASIPQLLQSLVGLGTRRLPERSVHQGEAFVYFGGHFAHQPRSAIGLESLLTEYLGTPVDVLQLQGQWLVLESLDQAILPGPAAPDGQNNQLGFDLILGERVWDVQSKIRIRVRGLTWSRFQDLVPGGEQLLPLSQVVRFYVGQELDFEVQCVLRPGSVPPCVLTPDPATGPRLGWNTWLRTRPLDYPVDDAVFSRPTV